MARNRGGVPKLSSFATKDSFTGWFNHSVTGSEINSMLVSPLQNSLSTINLEFGKLYDIAGQIYQARTTLMVSI